MVLCLLRNENVYKKWWWAIMQETKLRKQAFSEVTQVNFEYGQQNNMLFNYGLIVVGSLAVMFSHYFL